MRCGSGGRAAAGDPDLGSAGAQSAVTIGPQAVPLTGVVDQLELNVRARPAVPERHQNFPIESAC
jgi:hypothetical protein